jgi:hypothetical protein
MEAEGVMDRLICGDVGFGKRKLRFVRHLKQQPTENRLRFWFRQRFWLSSITEVSKNV